MRIATLSKIMPQRRPILIDVSYALEKSAGLLKSLPDPTGGA
jgi:hypothetical protein